MGWGGEGGKGGGKEGGVGGVKEKVRWGFWGWVGGIESGGSMEKGMGLGEWVGKGVRRFRRVGRGVG